MAGQLARNWWPGSTEWTTLGADEFHSTLVSGIYIYISGARCVCV